jgi:hypothetical protein
MNSPNSPGTEEADAELRCDCERAPHGRRADSSLDGACGQVARPELPGLGREALEAGAGEADADRAVEDADRRRHGAGFPHGCLAREPNLDAVRRRESVGDQGRLERDDRTPCLERVFDLALEDDEIVRRHAADPSS